MKFTFTEKQLYILNEAVISHIKTVQVRELPDAIADELAELLALRKAFKAELAKLA